MDDVELGVEDFEDIDVVIIGHGIPEGPIVGMKLANCFHDVHLMENVMDVAILPHLVRSSALELNEVGQQLEPHARQCVRIVPVTFCPTHIIEFRFRL